MSGLWKVNATMIMWFFTITILHVWQNIGFENVRFFKKEERTEKFRVGFLPVT